MAIDRLIIDAAYQIKELHNDWLKGPRPSKPWGHLCEGVVTKPTDGAKE
jgi:hypothetical protein